MAENIIDNYKIVVDGVPSEISIYKTPTEFVPIYKMVFPIIEPATQAVLDSIREKLVGEMSLRPYDILNLEDVETMKRNFFQRSLQLIESQLPNLSEKDRGILGGILIHHSLGLGEIEIMLKDQNLEEIVINNAKEPVWVYHRRIGWLKTNLKVKSENDVYNYASLIGRRVGTQITHLNPMMDAYLTTGDRSNATLFPISSKGNTLTIRKFASRPWTITDFIQAKTVSPEVAAFLWLAIQYEMNIIIAGGTASGKTSLLNVLTSFFQPNHRIISIEDTRELQLPMFLHWVPMTTRPANPEGKGEVTMLDLMINALRMRPDRVIVGEMRRSREAEVLFEAIHTGHSVYSTLHANTADEVIRRLTNPPINIPMTLLSSLQLIAVMHRDRRREIRRLLEISEIITGTEGNEFDLNNTFRWIPSKDEIVEIEKSTRVLDEIKLYTGMTVEEVEKDLNEKAKILKWLVKMDVKDVNKVGKAISEYYKDPKQFLKNIS